MNHKQYNSLTINGITLKGNDIIDYCHQSSENNINKIGVFIREWLTDSSTIQVQTSGSTGNPKIIEVEKKQLLASAKMTAKYFDFKPNQTALLALPMDYIAGKMMLVRALYSELNLICIEPTLQPFEQLANDCEIDFAPLTPMQLNNVNDTKLVKTILLGGGSISLELEEKIQSLNAAVYHSYGMTETLSHIAIRSINGNTKSSVFSALEGVVFNVDQRNCLVIDVPFLEKKLITNDVVELIDNKHFIWKGRIDFVINSGGIKLFPEAIEMKISSIIQQPFFIAAMPDAILGEKVGLFVEAKQQDTTKWIEQFKEVLSKYEMPKSIYFCTNFERTISGKIKRQATINKIKI